MSTSPTHTEPLPPLATPDLKDVCQKYHIRRLMVFGSTADGSRSPESDIDLLVEFEKGHIPGFSYSRIAEELTAIFEKPVDLHTPASLSKYFRDLVVAEARVVYAEEE